MVAVVSIVIPVFNKWEYTARCLRAVAANTRDVPHEVIVIDNASSDETARALPGLLGVRTQRNAQNLGFARASNQGAALATGRFLLFLNNDTEPHPGWASAMVAEMERDPAVAIVGSKLLYPDGTIQHAGVAFAYAMWQPIMPIHVDARQPATVASARRELDAVTAACMLVRPAIFQSLGGFDEGYVNGYEDVDLCLEVRARGGKIVFAPASVVTHYESVSEGRFDSSAANTERLMARWIDRLDRSQFRFDVDFRRTAQPLVVPPDRPGVSVVVVADRSIGTIAPCLENIWYTTGAQDEIVIVDDSGQGSAAGRFVARFAARHPDRVRVVAAEGGPEIATPAGFPRSIQVGLSTATRALAAVIGPNVRVVGDWVARLAAHLRADPLLGALTATLGDAGSLSTHELLWPVGRTDAGAGAPASGAPGAAPARLPVTVAPSFTLFGPTDRLRTLAATPAGLFGANPSATATHLAGQRLVLARAADVIVYRLNQIATGADPTLRERYLASQGATYASASGTRADGPTVSVVVVAQGDPALTRRCLEALERHTDTGDPVEIIVVDNGSTGPVARQVEASAARGHPGAPPFEIAVIENPRNQGFAFACNQGLDRARGQILAVVHDDVVVGPGWMRRAIALLATEPAIGMVGPASNDCPGPQRIRTASCGGPEDAAPFAELFAAEHQGELALVPRLAGMCLVMRREVVMRVGGFDTIFGLGKGADDDFSVRVARAGWKLAVALDVFVHHQGGVTYRRLGQDPRRAAEAGWRALCAKWHHPPARTAAVDLAALGAVPFDLARDRVPLRHEHVYCAEAPPLALSCRQPLRFLCVADETEPSVPAGRGWRGVFLSFVRAFTAHDPVALVIRVEPATPGAADRTLAEVSALLRTAGIPLRDVPEVLFEATPLPPARRGSIYTTARVFLTSDDAGDAVRARDAAACGLTVLGPGLPPAALRQAVRLVD